jgi:Protein of unknown function (DUF4230)
MNMDSGPDNRISPAEQIGPAQQMSPVQATPRRFSIGTLVLGILLGGLLLFGFARTGIWSRLAGHMFGLSTSMDTSSPAVVEKIRQLSRLETVVYSMDKIVGGERQSAYLPDFLVGDKLLLVAHGEVIAGVDLSQLKAGDVTVKGDAVKVVLPPPELLTARIDNGRTRIYSRTTGLFANADPNLESEVRLTAEQQITAAALADGILDKAKLNARTSVTALLYGLGFHTVDVQ